MPDHRAGEAEDALGDPRGPHQLAGKEEQRDREQGEIVHPADEELRHHLQRNAGAEQQQRGQRGAEQREHQRHAERCEPQHDPEQHGERHGPVRSSSGPSTRSSRIVTIQRAAPITTAA